MTVYLRNDTRKATGRLPTSKFRWRKAGGVRSESAATRFDCHNRRGATLRGLHGPHRPVFESSYFDKMA